MPRSTYKAMVRLSDGQMQEVTVQADNSFNATAMLEAQYGRGSVFGVPHSQYQLPPLNRSPRKWIVGRTLHRVCAATGLITLSPGSFLGL